MKNYPSNWAEISSKTREESNYTCSKCGKVYGKKYSYFLHTHHKKPISKGGKSYSANLRVLCWDCHKKKHKHHIKKLRFRNGKRILR